MDIPLNSLHIQFFLASQRYELSEYLAVFLFMALMSQLSKKRCAVRATSRNHKLTQWSWTNPKLKTALHFELFVKK